MLDPSGGAVTGASVVFTTPTGDTLAETTNQQGIFDRNGLAPGKYTVQVIAKGFAIYKNDDVEIAAGQIQQLNVKLEIEEQEEKVVVSDEAPTVDVSPANNAGAIVISGKELEAPPGRSGRIAKRFNRARRSFRGAKRRPILYRWIYRWPITP